ncbi:glycosyl hydrolase [Actinoplanes sp. NEAU-A12]|uniref:glucan endo-1,3-beta-D-glucosidase n=1 Tax=Actinoplanes sandaracinus TaxID=3045177 RepID=A0ABT6WWU3_9ACTN|nr:glycosyl hydrolase [Actinoplanes sandaracinus]MDI6104190.1 glycosyl hydrolase [Actinoplanes sandaracinus]
MRAGLRRIVTAACLLSTVVLTASCTEGPEPDVRDPERAAPAAGVLSEGDATTSVRRPATEGKAGLADTLPATASPKQRPARAGQSLAGQALPTNQWWTSVLTGAPDQPIWARPLAIKRTDAGLAVSSATATASAKAVVTPFAPALVAAGPMTVPEVVGYGAFHVVLRAGLRGGGTVELTVVQGSPLLYLDFRDAKPALTATGPLHRGDGGGPLARLTIAGQRWDVQAQDGAEWRQDGDRLTVDRPGRTAIVVARVPDQVDDAAWTDAIAAAAGDPVIRTTSHMAYDGAAGTVTQTLTAERRSGRPGVWALLPHQQKGLVRDDGVPQPLAGTYSDALGPLSVVRGPAVRVRVPMPGLITEVPAVTLSDPARAAVLDDLQRDLADEPPTADGGSYFGLKELGRLATLAEVAKGIGARPQQDAALQRLRAGLVDWLTYGGAGDTRYFVYDQTWGGLIAVPAEFGSNDYNDHHFQYGYLVRAAAVLAEADPAFLRDYGAAVSLVARDYSGTLSGSGADGFPAFRAFNAYLGHSAASGFAPFADGNNQESSGEAVAAWEAVARWGLVTGDADLTAYGVTHYALEAATARMYWLGEGLQRPAGYEHTVAGIVWDAKIDYATWFDPKPESIVGIQLLPLTFGSLYRGDAGPAAARSTQLGKEVGGMPRVWGDLFAADLAIADPAQARARLGPQLPREESTSRAMVRYWVEMLAAYGSPQPAVVADGPFGMAFGSAEHPRLLAVNPTAAQVTVTFRRQGAIAATVVVDPGQSVVRRL